MAKRVSSDISAGDFFALVSEVAFGNFTARMNPVSVEVEGNLFQWRNYI